MDTIVGDYYLLDNSLYKSRDINYSFDDSDYRLYEVIRSMSGVLLFLEDHLDRLKKGINKIDIAESIEEIVLKKQLRKLIESNNFREGNIKILFSALDERHFLASYYIPHSYPDPVLYETGVALNTFTCERPDPLIKQVKISNSVRGKIKQEKLNNDVFEVLLLNDKNCITEGSKSNFFLVNGNTLFSAPPDSILPGITRKYVLNIANKKGIDVIYKWINIKDIDKFDAAFICGTSPGIMPVNRINKAKLTPNNPIINSIRSEYDSIIQEYIKLNKY